MQISNWTNFIRLFFLERSTKMGVVQKKFRKPHKKKLSQEEKFDKDLKDCMRCKYFWGNNSRCIQNKCCKETEQPVVKKAASECDDCPYNTGNGYCFPCMKKILGK
jgi:hypothetical protein